jgi:hypothetical protein
MRTALVLALLMPGLALAQEVAQDQVEAGAAPTDQPATALPDQAATAPTTIEARRAIERQRLEMTLKGIETMPAQRLEEIFTLSTRDGFIVVHPKLAQPTEGQLRAELTDLEGVTLVQMIGEPDAPPDTAVGLTVQNYMFDRPGLVLMITQVFLQPEHLQIARGVDAEEGETHLDLIQRPMAEDSPEDRRRQVSLRVQRFDPDGERTAQLALFAENFSELRRNHPSETQFYLRPVLRDLNQEHILAIDPRLGWQVLSGDLKVDEKLLKQIEQILAKFDSDRFQEREAAAQELEKLGQPAAIALMKADRSGWSIERQSGVDSFLADFKLVEHRDVKALRDSAAFLLDCLYSDSQTLRDTAYARLKDLHGEEVADLDPHAPAQQRYDKIDELYRQLLPPPATQLKTH